MLAPVHPVLLILFLPSPPMGLCKREEEVWQSQQYVKQIKMFPVYPGKIKTKMHIKMSNSELQLPAPMLYGAAIPSVSKSCSGLLCDHS